MWGGEGGVVGVNSLERKEEMGALVLWKGKGGEGRCKREKKGKKPGERFAGQCQAAPIRPCAC